MRSILWVLLSAGFAGIPRAEAPGAFAPDMPGWDDALVPTGGLPGVGDPGLGLCDRAVTRSGRVRMDFRGVGREVGSRSWAQRLYELETEVAPIPGWAFGLSIEDDRSGWSVRDSGRRTRLRDPYSGVRLGAGVDLLAPWKSPDGWSWGLEGWWSLLDPRGRTEVRTTLRRRRDLRADLSWSFRRAEVPLERARDSGDGTWLATDSLTWGGDEELSQLRIGGRVSGAALQAWGGYRRVRDPGASDSTRRLAERAFFAGLQVEGRLGSRAHWDVEARVERGRDTLRGPSGGSRLARGLVAGRLELGMGFGPLRPQLSFSGTRSELSARAEGDGGLPEGWRGAPGGAATIQRAGAELLLGLPAWKGLALAPAGGVAHLAVRGTAPPEWTSLRDPKAEAGWTPSGGADLEWGRELTNLAGAFRLAFPPGPGRPGWSLSLSLSQDY